MRRVFVCAVIFILTAFNLEAQVIHPKEAAKQRVGNSSSTKKRAVKPAVKNAALPGNKADQTISKKTTLLLIPNTDCEIIVDAVSIGQTKTNLALKAEVDLGNHLVVCKSIDGKDILQQTVEVKSFNQQIINLDILALINSRIARATEALILELNKWSTSGSLVSIPKIKDLIVAGADVNTKNDHGVTALHIAAVINSKSLAQLLIDKGADVNIVGGNINGSMPLHFAAQNDSKDVAKILLDNEAQVNATRQSGDNPYTIASLRGFEEMKNLLASYGGKKRQN